MAERSTRGIPTYTGRKKPTVVGVGVRSRSGRKPPTTVGVGIRSVPKKPGQKQAPPSHKR